MKLEDFLFNTVNGLKIYQTYEDTIAVDLTKLGIESKAVIVHALKQGDKYTILFALFDDIMDLYGSSVICGKKEPVRVAILGGSRAGLGVASRILSAVAPTSDIHRVHEKFELDELLVDDRFELFRELQYATFAPKKAPKDKHAYLGLDSSKGKRAHFSSKTSKCRR